MRTRTRLTALAAAVTMIGSACGGASLDVEPDPRGAVVEAFRNMGDWQGTSMTMRVDTTVESLIAVAEGDPMMTPDLARTIIDSYLRVEAFMGPDAADTSDDSFDMTLNIGGEDAFQMRAVDETFYLRAAVRDLVGRFDTSGNGIAGLDEMISAAPPTFDFLDAAADGAWLQIGGVEELGNMMAGMTGVPQPDPSEVAEANAAVAAMVERFLDEDVAVAYLGTDDHGEHVRLTSSGTQLLELMDEMFAVMAASTASPFGGADPGLIVDEMRREIGADAERFTMPVDVWIRGDTVSRIGIDLVTVFEANAALMAEEGPPPIGLEKLGLSVELEEFGGDVDVPSDAIEINVFEIFGMLMSGFGATPTPA